MNGRIILGNEAGCATKGRLRFFNRERGWGLIRPDGRSAHRRAVCVRGDGILPLSHREVSEEVR
jgi:hypothetical protein